MGVCLMQGNKNLLLISFQCVGPLWKPGWWPLFHVHTQTAPMAEVEWRASWESNVSRGNRGPVWWVHRRVITCQRCPCMFGWGSAFWCARSQHAMHVFIISAICAAVWVLFHCWRCTTKRSWPLNMRTTTVVIAKKLICDCWNPIKHHQQHKRLHT